MEILNFSPLFEGNGRTAKQTYMIFARRANPEKQKKCPFNKSDRWTGYGKILNREQILFP